ncbi:helix-turn-helix domain-containing protein [Sphingobium sp. ZW T5_29]|uniref:helix-turn-helix domain-containing protein n=1 Tax=Sphingobium sp. ZW T5_29 TaxID=3378077 RepID=UPI003851E4A2
MIDRLSSKPGMSDRVAAARQRLAAKRAEESGELSRGLADLRLASGLSQKQLAEKIGTSQPVISMYESGEREPMLSAIEALAGALNVDANSVVKAYRKNG